MTVTNVTICVGGELEARAQSVLADLGLDVPTAFNMFLMQVIDRGTLPFEMDGAKTVQKKHPRSEGRSSMKTRITDDFYPPLPPGTIRPDPTKIPQLGCMEGKIWMADDFDAPMEEFEEYM